MDEDWLDDYMIMQMMEEDEHQENLSSSESSGCLPAVLWGILILYVFLNLIG